MTFRLALYLVAMVTLGSSFAHAEYDAELRNQISEIQERYDREVQHKYFYDMGILARKADEADYTDLTSEIVGSLLLKQMDAYISSELERINRLYRREPGKASRALEDLYRYQRYYQPTREYLSTTGGQAFSGELARHRKNSLGILNQGCSAKSIEEGLKSIRKTGLFVTNRPEEIRSMRELNKVVDCCMRFKSKIHYYESKDFESDYEAGKIIEEGKFSLKSSPRKLSEANWVGKWIYRFEGREGTAEAVSDANLIFRKGEDMATLTITAAKVSSAGRINFPITVSGDRRTLEVIGDPIYPEVLFSSLEVIPFAGCMPNKVEKGK